MFLTDNACICIQCWPEHILRSFSGFTIDNMQSQSNNKSESTCKGNAIGGLSITGWSIKTVGTMKFAGIVRLVHSCAASGFMGLLGHPRSRFLLAARQFLCCFLLGCCLLQCSFICRCATQCLTCSMTSRKLCTLLNVWASDLLHSNVCYDVI